MQFPFFANGLFWASRDNLSLKRLANHRSQVVFAAGARGKPKRCRAVKVVKGPYI